MSLPSIRCSLPFSWGAEKQTCYGLTARIGIIALGAIAVAAGILTLCKIPGICALGPTIGGFVLASGSVLLLLGLCIRCMKKSSPNEIQQPQILPQPRSIHSSVSENALIQDAPIDFGKITHENYENHIDVEQKYRSDSELGELVFIKATQPIDFKFGDRNLKKGDIVLFIYVRVQENSNKIAAGRLAIGDSEFVYYPEFGKAEHFSNLKVFFNFLFRGEHFAGNTMKQLNCFVLRTVNGKKIYYPNPHLRS